MPNYNFLPHNESEFPHISNVDTFKYDNEFDYGRFDYDQMSLQVCSVPWDMGEAHIGNRTISGIGNVVYFGDKAARDAWFDAIPDSECYRFTSKFKELHRDGFIDVPIPYDMCAKHNYLVVHYEKFANENSPVMFEGDDGLRDWFWFIREVEFLAPNTTRLHIMDDAWCTWIYDVTVKGMILERGHAPMFATRADTYLENPLNHNQNLLTEDVNYGQPEVCKHIDALALNGGDMWACIATTANPLSTDWGTKAAGTWKVPAKPYNVHDGVPSIFVFGIETADLDDFLNTVNSSVPQFAQTIQGVFFASKELVSATGNPFTFAGVTCHLLAGGRKTFDFVKLDKAQFGYRAEYADLAKLYTSPYAHIEVTDENGEVDVIKIEDTDGEIDVYAIMSLAYPFVNVDAHLMGVGGNTRASVTFRNISARTFSIEGRWYETLRSWNVPTFAVIQEASVNNDYATHFDRVQAVNDYVTAKNNADASADTGKDNADASANTGKANADAAADTLVANTKIATDTATEITTSIHNPYITDINTANNNKIDSDAAIASSVTLAQAAASNDFAAVSNGMSQAANVGSAVVGALNVANVGEGSILGGLVGIAQSEIGAIASNSITTQAIVKDSQIAQTIANANYAYALNATTLNNLLNGASGYIPQENAATTVAQNASATDQADNSSDLQKANATRTQTTEKANATRTQTTEKANATREQTRAQNAIANGINQAALGEPMQYGAFAAGESAVTRPMGLFAHIVTQTASAIASAGDEFLRYGYMLDRQWSFDGNWNVGKYFTYWKLKDFWVSNLNVPDMYMDRLRFFLFGGVTVWRKPEDIGKVSVYENYNG